MPFELPKELLDAGGWVFAALLAAAILWAIVKGKLVPGVTHDREVARADRATDQLEKEGDTNRELLTAVKALTETLGQVLKLRSP